MPPRVSLLFVGDFEQVYVQCVKSAARLYFAVLVCSSFSWGQHYSVLALNIVDSPILVFIPIVSGQFEQALPNLSSFNQSTVSSSLRKLVKPKKSEKHSRSFAWKLISKPSYIDFIIYLDTCDVWWNYRVIQPQNKNNSRTFLNEEKATCKTHNFYTLLLFFLIIIALLIAVIIYSYLIKYWAKQKHLLPFQFINNKLKI